MGNVLDFLEGTPSDDDIRMRLRMEKNRLIRTRDALLARPNPTALQAKEIVYIERKLKEMEMKESAFRKVQIESSNVETERQFFKWLEPKKEEMKTQLMEQPNRIRDMQEFHMIVASATNPVDEDDLYTEEEEVTLQDIDYLPKPPTTAVAITSHQPSQDEVLYMCKD